MFNWFKKRAVADDVIRMDYEETELFYKLYMKYREGKEDLSIPGGQWTLHHYMKKFNADKIRMMLADKQWGSENHDTDDETLAWLVYLTVPDLDDSEKVFMKLKWGATKWYIGNQERSKNLC